jgi:hypothetical protein
MDEQQQGGADKETVESPQAGETPTGQTPQGSNNPKPEDGYQPGQGGYGGGGYSPGQSQMPGGITSRPADDSSGG